MGTVYAIMVSTGSAVAFFLGYGLPKDKTNIENNFWRVMLGLIGVLNILHLLIFLTVLKEDTPNFYMQ